MKLIVASVLLFLATPASAQVKANEWLKYCDAKNTNQNICFYYARGFADGLRWENHLHGDNAKTCIPKEVTAIQLIKVGQSFLSKNPQHLHRDLGTVLAAAFMEAWPCEKKTTDLDGLARGVADMMSYEKHCGGMVKNDTRKQFGNFIEQVGTDRLNAAFAASNQYRENVGKDEWCAHVLKSYGEWLVPGRQS